MDMYREVAAESKDMKLVTKAKYNLGNSSFQQGSKQRDSNLQKAIEDMEAAIGHWSEALRLRPDNADAHNNMGIARAQQGRLDEAISHFKKALQINPDDNRIRENLARSLRLSTSPARTQNGPER